MTLGSQSYDLVGRVNGVPTAAIRLYLRPGANALNVKQAVVARMNELARNFPAGVSWFIPFDTTPFITASIDEVVKTLFEAMVLVTLVVFIFLQNWRTTLIPVLAVPVAIIGTFFGLQVLGFQINLLTLFALVLAIGIVVDDAIVVIENVERIMAEEKVSPPVAADRAMGQVASALVAIVLSLCAVFLPVAFLGGITGKMYTQFAITLVVSVVISGIVALTLTPALCAVLLKPNQGESRNRLFGWFNRGFGRVTEGYVRSVGGVIARPSRWIACFAVMLVLIAVLVRRVPSGFIPTEDKGYFGVVVQLPDGASLQRTVEVTQRDRGLPPEAAGRGLRGQLRRLELHPRHQPDQLGVDVRAPEAVGRADQEGGSARRRAAGGPTGSSSRSTNAVAFGFNLPEIPGLGTTAGLEVNLQDRSVNDIRKFAGLVNEYTQQANAQPELQGVQSLMRVNVPQIYVHVDREKVKSLGVSLSDVFQTLQTMLSTLYVNDFNLYGRTYRVQLEAQSQFRQKPEDIGRLYVRGPGRGHDPDLQSGPDRVSGRTQSGAAVQRVHLRAGDRPAQAGLQLRPDARGGAAAGRLGVRSPRGGLRVQRPVVSGERRQWTGRRDLRVRPGHGVPGAGGAVRELVDPLCRAVRHSLRRLRRVPRRVAARHGERRLLPDRAAGGGRDSRPRTRF